MRMPSFAVLSAAVFMLAIAGRTQAAETANPAAVPVPQRGMEARHAQKVAAVKKEKFDLILIGDSITHTMGDYGGEYEPLKKVWGQFFAPRHALNLGYSGARTENILWNLQNGELDGQSPKVVTLMIGTNNADEKNYPTHHNAGQIAGGIEAIVKLLRQKLPDTKIILLRCFPYGEKPADPANTRNAVLDRASELARQRVVDDRHVFYCDVNRVFLKPDGTVDKALMPDFLHPHGEGGRRWVAAMEPLLCKLMGDENRALPGEGPFNTCWPGFGGYRDARLAKFAKGKAGDRGAVVFLGDSITEGWNLAQAFPELKTANRGISGDTSRGMLCRLQDNVLDLAPRAVILLCGTNDLSQVPPATADQVAANVRLMLEAVRAAAPGTPVLVCEIFPSSKRDAAAVLAANTAVDTVVTNFPDARRIRTYKLFLKPDGTQNLALFTDGTHLKPDGYAAWKAALMPELEKLAPAADANTAVVPVPKLENDCYDWYARHADELKTGPAVNPEVVLIGDSITHFWGGEPKSVNPRGPKAWASVFGGRRVLNLGFGWDRTQNVLWRLDHGEFDGLHPRVVILNIGTNNTSGTSNARQNTPAETAEGVRAVCDRVRAKAPNAKIILMAVFPREEKPDHPRRAQIAEINRRLAELGKTPGITFLDIGPKMLSPDGTISREIMSDFCHPTEKGYQIWADALKPLLQNMLK